jgi:uncharacterized coiled-coil protein SlyX
LSTEYSDEFDPGVTLPPRRNWILRVIVAVVGLVILAGAAGFVLLNYGHLFDPAPAAQLPISVNVEEAVSPDDFKAFQQDVATKLEAVQQAAADQQADLKRLADQVGAMAAKLETLQSPPAAAAVAPVRPPVVAMTKRPAAAKKPASTISVGGAPLPPQARQ